MFPKKTKYKINQQVWCQFDNGSTLISTVKAIFIRANGFVEYCIHGYDYCLNENNLSVTDKLPEVIYLITAPGC